MLATPLIKQNHFMAGHGLIYVFRSVLGEKNPTMKWNIWVWIRQLCHSWKPALCSDKREQQLTSPNTRPHVERPQNNQEV